MNNKINYIYVVKTENELIREFGYNWRRSRINFVREMDYLLGQKINKYKILSTNSITVPNKNNTIINYWTLHTDHLKKIYIIPKKMIYE